MNNTKNFKENGYLIIPKILSGELLDFIGIHAYNRVRLLIFLSLQIGDGARIPNNPPPPHGDGARMKDPQAPNTPSFIGDFVMENLSDFLLPKIESATGMKLLPTYTYFRVYKAGDILKKHVDRPSCEISISLCLRKKGNIWPIYVNNTDYKMVEGLVERPTDLENMHQEHIGDTTSILLEEGDAVLYKGCELVHWRESYTEGTKLAQVFLHYVDANGPYTEWKNDQIIDPAKPFVQDR